MQPYRSSKNSGRFPKIINDTPILFHDSLLSDSHRVALVDARVPKKIFWFDENYLAIDFSLSTTESELFAESRRAKFFLLDLPVETAVGCGIDWALSNMTIVLNANHPLVLWLARVKVACANDEGITNNQFRTLLELLDRCNWPFGEIGKLQDYLAAWSKLPGLLPDLYPPNVSLSWEMFELPYWRSRK